MRRGVYKSQGSSRQIGMITQKKEFQDVSSIYFLDYTTCFTFCGDFDRAYQGGKGDDFDYEKWIA